MKSLKSRFNKRDGRLMIQYASNNNVEKLKNLISDVPELVEYKQPESKKLAIWYSLKNRHLDSTIFLWNIGQRFGISDINFFIYQTKNPIKWIDFINNISTICEIDLSYFDLIYNIKENCYRNNNFLGLSELLDHQYKESLTNDIRSNFWNSCLQEYLKYKPNPKKDFLREIKMEILNV